jgi:hypothetical protein
MTRSDAGRALALTLTGLLMIPALCAAKDKPVPVVQEWIEQPVLCLPLGSRIHRIENGEKQRYTTMEAVADSAFLAGITKEVADHGLSWTLPDGAALAADPATLALLTRMQDVLAEVTLNWAVKFRSDQNTEVFEEEVSAERSPTGKGSVNKYDHDRRIAQRLKAVRDQLSTAEQAELAGTLAGLTESRYAVFPSYYGLSKDMGATAGTWAKGTLATMAAQAAASSLPGVKVSSGPGLASGEYDVALYILDLQTGEFTDMHLLGWAPGGAGMVSENKAMPKRINRFLGPVLKQIKKENKKARKEIAKQA